MSAENLNKLSKLIKESDDSYDAFKALKLKAGSKYQINMAEELMVMSLRVKALCQIINENFYKVLNK